MKQKAEGLMRKLCCLTLEDNNTVALGKEPIRLAGKEEIISCVASGGYGYSVGESILFAYLPVEHSKPGTALEIELFGDWMGAQVVKAPLGS